jgi:hypothetical protein
MRRRDLICALPLALAPLAAVAEEQPKRRGGGLTFIPFRTLTANMPRADGKRGVFSVEAGIDVPDPRLHERAETLRPMLLDAYAQTLFVYAASLRPQMVPDLDLLATKLQADTDRVLGRPGAHLLLGSCLVE